MFFLSCDLVRLHNPLYQSFQKLLTREYAVNHIGILIMVEALIQDVWKPWVSPLKPAADLVLRPRQPLS